MILAIIVLLACLTTSIGLVTSCAQYFSTQFGGLSYKWYAVLFSVVSTGVGMFGLKTIITSAIPVLMFLYPLAIVLIFLAFLDPVFKGRQCVYAWTVGATFITALVSGLETAKVDLGNIGRLFSTQVPMHGIGMDWIVFGGVGLVIGLIHRALVKAE